MHYFEMTKSNIFTPSPHSSAPWPVQRLDSRTFSARSPTAFLTNRTPHCTFTMRCQKHNPPRKLWFRENSLIFFWSVFIGLFVAYFRILFILSRSWVHSIVTCYKSHRTKRRKRQISTPQEPKPF